MQTVAIVFIMLLGIVLMASSIYIISSSNDMFGLLIGCLCIITGVFLIVLCILAATDNATPVSKIDTPEDALKVCIQHYNDTNQTYLISSMCYNNKK